jgi:hypothetical protein
LSRAVANTVRLLFSGHGRDTSTGIAGHDAECLAAHDGKSRACQVVTGEAGS